MRFDVSQVSMGNYSFPTKLGGSNDTTNFSTPEDPHWMRVNMVLGNDPFLQLETPFEQDLWDFAIYMSEAYPEIKLYQTKNRYNHTVVFGSTKKRTCNQFISANPLQNFTFNTSHEHQFHIPASALLFDTHFGMAIGECLLSILLVQDPDFAQKSLFLGDPFFMNYNVSIDFDMTLIGFEGHRTEFPKPVDPNPPVDPPTPVDPTKPDPDPSHPSKNSTEEEVEEEPDDVEEEYSSGDKHAEDHAFLAALLFSLGSIAILMGLTFACMKCRRDRLDNQLSLANKYEGLGTYSGGGFGHTR
jgi:hypothetical protein